MSDKAYYELRIIRDGQLTEDVRACELMTYEESKRRNEWLEGPGRNSRGETVAKWVKAPIKEAPDYGCVDTSTSASVSVSSPVVPPTPDPYASGGYAHNPFHYGP
jgi:hypothetical protein